MLQLTSFPRRPRERHRGSLDFIFPVFPECVAQPEIERHLLAIASAHEVRLAGKQALRRSQSDKILRCLNLPLEMFILIADMPHCFLRGMRLPVSDDGCAGGIGLIEKTG